MRIPRPPQKSTTFIESSFFRQESGEWSRVHFDLGDGYDELAAPLPDVRHLFHDLVPEIPGQDQDVVRLGLADPVGVEDRHVGARQELALLVRAAIHRVVEEVRPDAAVVQQGVALAGCAVAGDGLALALGSDQEIEELALGLLYLLAERRVAIEPREAGDFLARPQFGDTGADWLSLVLHVPRVDP